MSLVVGFIGNEFLIIDTHCIPIDLGGNVNTIIKVVHCNGKLQNGAQSVLELLEKRMIKSVGSDRVESRWCVYRLKKRNDEEMTCFSDVHDDIELLLSLTEDFNETDDISDDEDDALLASLSYPEELSTKTIDGVDQASLLSRPAPLKKHDIPTIKEETNDVSAKLWEYPPGYRDAHNESTELLWKGHLTKFQLTTFKRFRLDAIHAVEAKKDVVVVQKTWQWKEYLLSSSVTLRQNKSHGRYLSNDIIN